MSRQLLRYHPVIGHTFVPGLQTRVHFESGGFLLRANEVGFRSEREYVPRNPDGSDRAVRALFFGDSFTAGHGVRNEERFTDILENRIEGLEVFNFGLNGTGPDQQYLIWREFAQDLDYDVIVHCPWVDNIARSYATHQKYQLRDDAPDLAVFARPHFVVMPNGDLELRHVPVPPDPVDMASLGPEYRVYPYSAPNRPRLRRLVYKLGPRVIRIARKLAKSEPQQEYASANDPAWVLLRAILEHWYGQLTTPVLLAPIPLPQHIEDVADPEVYLRRFRELSDPPAVTLHDFIPEFRTYPLEQRAGFHFVNDYHSSPAGHIALADSLEAPLRALVERALVSRGARDASASSRS